MLSSSPWLKVPGWLRLPCLHGAIPKSIAVTTPSPFATWGACDREGKLVGFPCVRVQTDTVLGETVYDMSCDLERAGTLYTTPQQALEASGLDDCQALSAFYLEYVGLAVANGPDAKSQIIEWLDALRQQATDCGEKKVYKRLTVLRSKASGDAPPPPVTLSQKELDSRIKKNEQARQARLDDLVERYVGKELQSLFGKEQWSMDDQRDLLIARQSVDEDDSEDDEEEESSFPPRFVRQMLYRLLIHYGRGTEEMADLHRELQAMETDERCVEEASVREELVGLTDSELIRFVNSL
jgi:hypothetical protein